MFRQMEKDVEEMETKTARPLQKFFLLVLIPLLVAIAAGLIVATAAGVNVFDKAKNLSQKIPVAGSLFQKENAESVKTIEKNVNDLQAQLKDRNAEISQLQEKLDNKDQELQKVQLDNSKLQQDITDLTESQKQAKRALKDLISTYETISPKKAAPIISKMSDAEALKILTSVKPDVLAGIMENMDPAQAARFTELMTTADGSSKQGNP